MQLQGSRMLHAPREQVWALLSEPPALSAFVPGCEALTAQAEGSGYDAVIAARVGPVAARFKGTLTLDDREPPRRYRLRFQGRGGAAGFTRGEAVVELAEQGSITLLSYSVQAQVGGKLAQVGSRLIDVTAGKLADEFFTRMAAQFAAPAALVPAAAAQTDEDVYVFEPPTRAETPRRPLLPWAAAAGALVLAAAWWLTASPA